MLLVGLICILGSSQSLSERVSGGGMVGFILHSINLSNNQNRSEIKHLETST
jgi:hypothetical protein